MKIKSDKQSRMRIICMLAACVLLCCLSVRVHAESQYQVTEMQLQGVITTDSTLNVRSGPGKDYDVIKQVKNDTILTISGKTDNGWYQVELNGRTGYVSGDYVEAEELEAEETIGEPEEGYRGLRQSPYIMKLGAIGAVILAVLIMLVLTLRGMRRDDEYDDDEYDDEEDDDEYDDEEADEYENDEDDDEEADEYEDDEDDDGEADEYEEDEAEGEEADDDDDDADSVARAVRKQAREGIKKREYIIREEDYRVDIDPSFFEDKEPIEQPAMVTGYLERKRIEEAMERGTASGAAEGAERVKESGDMAGARAAAEIDKQRKLNLAMEKLDELQKEIERLKNDE